MKPFTVSITYQTLRGNLAVAAYIIQSNTGTFVLDCAYGGYRLGRICNEGGGEHDLTARGTARETYYAIGAYINGAQAMKDAA